MFFNRFYAVISCTIAFLLLAQARVAAQTVPPNLKNLDIKQICAGTNARYLLARSIIDNYKISSKMLDWNDNGVIEPRRMASELMCAGKLTTAQELKCFGARPETGAAGVPELSPDNLVQNQLVQDVNALFRTLQDAKGDIKLGDDKASISFRKVRQVSELDARRQPLLGLDGGFSTAAQVFSEAPTYYDIQCHVAPQKPAQPVAAGGNGRPANGARQGAGIGSPIAPTPSTIPLETVADRFRLRGKADDLWIGRDAEGFAGLSGASFAVSNDQIARKSNFDAHLVLGYALPAWQSGGVVLDSIPYIKYDRSYIDGVKPTGSNNVNNIAAGLQQRLTFPITESFYNAVIFQPQFVNSLRTGAQVLSLRLTYEPEPLVPYLGFIAETPIPGLWATAYARGVTNYYEVVHSANDGTLSSSKSFWHVGAQLGGVLMFKDGTLSGLSFPIDYTYFYGVSGPYKSVELLQIAANYTLPKTKYVTIGLSYTSGRNLDTFELQKVYKASLGLKY
jgi:hypothetical protein